MTGAIFNWLRTSWDTVRTSLWLVPGAMFVLGFLLALVMLRIDQGSTTIAGDGWLSWVASGTGDDARNLLSTLLTSVIAMASIVFSVTVLSLSLAANTYGPRLVRTFRANRRTQLVLGMFILTIVYVLIVLRAVRGEARPDEVPDAAVAVGTALALACVIGLLAFVQSVARLMVADEVILRVRRELDSAIERLPPCAGAEGAATADLPKNFEQIAARIRLPREGYVQSIEHAGLVHWAEQHDAVLRLDFRPGDFVVEGDHKLLIAPPPSNCEQARSELAKFIVSGSDRSPTQDLEFAIRHLVEVAVRALSPGINDPFTAMAVLDRLRGAVARLCSRQMPPGVLTDESGRVRVARKVTSFAGAADAALNQIRQAAETKADVLIHLARSIGGIAEHTRTDEQRAVLVRHANLVLGAAERGVGDAADRADVEAAVEQALRALNAAGERSAA